MAQFALIIEYETGTVARLVDTPDLHVSLNNFVEELKQQYTGNKDCTMIPKILSARITPVWYEQKYK